MKLTDYRVALSGFSKKNDHLVPHSAIKDIWLRRIQPVKKPVFIDQYGLSLLGLEVRHLAMINENKDFEAVAAEAGIANPLIGSARFILSDGPAKKLPLLAPDHSILTMIELGKASVWEGHPLNAAVTRIEVPSTTSNVEMKNVVLDILLDLSFANSFIPQFWFERLRLAGPRLYQDKVSFLLQNHTLEAHNLGLSSSAPYVSFSRAARENDKACSEQHLKRFVQIWDSFFQWKLQDLPNSREHASDLILSYPKIGRQLSPRSILKCISAVPSGTHLFITRRKSKQTAPDELRDRLHSVFTELEHKGTGAREFGFMSTSILSSSKKNLAQRIKRLANEGYLYIIRVQI